MNAYALLGGLTVAFGLLIVFTKREQDLEENPATVQSLLHEIHHALATATKYVDKDKVPHRVMNALDSSLCKLMCNVRTDKKESTSVSVLYGHFKHVLDEFLVTSSHSHEYSELKKHIEEQYDHIHHELAAVAQRRGVELAGAHH